MCPGSLDVCCKDPDFVKPVKPTPSPFTKEDSQESKESEEDETDYGIGSLFDAVPLSHCVDAQGNLHKLGESYTAQDGCNTCTCQEKTAACTMMLCPPDHSGGEYCPQVLACGSDGVTYNTPCDVPEGVKIVTNTVR